MSDWPSWRYGPNGGSGVFDSADDVPKGWQDHPAKVDPLDHDGDGEPGGSLPKTRRKVNRRDDSQ